MKVSYNLLDEEIKEEAAVLLKKKKEGIMEGYDSEDAEQYKDLNLYNTSAH